MKRKNGPEEITMGELASVMTATNWQQKPETIMAFFFNKIQKTPRPKKYFSILREDRFSCEEMLLLQAEVDEIIELRRKRSTMSYLKAWRSGTRKKLRAQEAETLDLRRVCQYFLYSYIRAGGKEKQLLPRFMDYTLAHF